MDLNVRCVTADCSDFPKVLRTGSKASVYSQIWAIGDLAILDRPLLGLVCSIRCPGDVILKTYDMIQALREQGVPIIGGFHSPMEKDCLDILLRGTQPIVICPARGLSTMQLPVKWRKGIKDGQLLILSIFEPKHKRLSAPLAEKRNQFVADICTRLFIPHASSKSKTEKLAYDQITKGKTIYTLDLPSNTYLKEVGIAAVKINHKWDTI